MNSSFLKRISKVVGRGGGKKLGSWKVQSVRLHFRRKESRKVNVFSMSHFLHSGGKKARLEPRAGGDPHRFISDLQLSPSVSAAKKLPFNVVLSSSVLPCQDPNRKKQDRQSLHSTAWGPHDNSNPLTDCPYQPSAGQSTQALQNHRLGGPHPFLLSTLSL